MREGLQAHQNSGSSSPGRPLPRRRAKLSTRCPQREEGQVRVFQPKIIVKVSLSPISGVKRDLCPVCKMYRLSPAAMTARAGLSVFADLAEVQDEDFTIGSLPCRARIRARLCYREPRFRHLYKPGA